MLSVLRLLAPVLLVAGCNRVPEATSPPAPVPSGPVSLAYHMQQAYPHDTNAFTEGFFVHDGVLYESTGATPELPQTRSLFGVVDLTTGKIETKAELDRTRYFGEGITLLNGKIFQLTYITRIGFVYDAKTYKKLGEFTLPGKEGWGLTTDGQHLILSDGTDVLTWLDPESYTVVRTVRVTENGYAKDLLNELEYIDGALFANVWNTPTIVRISPADGKITGILDLSQLAAEAQQLYPGSLEMNGIAWDQESKTMYVTGKMWPRIYALTLRQ